MTSLVITSLFLMPARFAILMRSNAQRDLKVNYQIGPMEFTGGQRQEQQFAGVSRQISRTFLRPGFYWSNRLEGSLCARSQDWDS